DGHRRSPRRSPAAGSARAAAAQVQPARAQGHQVGDQVGGRSSKRFQSSRRVTIMNDNATLRSGLECTLEPFANARTLPGAVYTSPEVFRLEQSGLFARQWMCAGRESDIPSPGDYFLKDIAGNSVIL